MPKKPFHQLSDRQRSFIFKTCCELFAQNGYVHTSVKTITKKLKVADGYLYYYFDGKKDLAKWIINTSNQTWKDHFQLNVRQKSYKDIFELIKLIIKQGILFTREHSEIYGAYLKFINEPNFQLTDFMVDEISWIDTVYEDAVKEELEKGSIRSDLPPDMIVMAMDLFITRIQEFSFNSKLDPLLVSRMNDAQLDEFIEQVLSMLKHGILSDQ